MDMPNELYVASFIEIIDGDAARAPNIIGIFGDAERAYAAVMADMNEFAEDMNETWTIDKWSMRAVNTDKFIVKWGVMAASVDY